MKSRIFKKIKSRIALWHLGIIVAMVALYMLINLAFVWHEELFELKE